MLQHNPHLLSSLCLTFIHMYQPQRTCFAINLTYRHRHIATSFSSYFTSCSCFATNLTHVHISTSLLDSLNLILTFQPRILIHFFPHASTVRFHFLAIRLTSSLCFNIDLTLTASFQPYSQSHSYVATFASAPLTST